MVKALPIRASILAFMGAVSIAAYAVADGAKPVNIPAGDLKTALEALARQAGTELVYRPEQVQGLKTKGVQGELSVQQAVTKLLEGTPLRMSVNGKGAMLIAAPLETAKPTASVTYAVGPRVAAIEGQGSERAPADASTDAATSAETRSQSVKLEEILVTAQKREEKARDVPVPVTAIEASALATTNALRLQDYYAKIPGLSIVPGSSSSTLGVVAIRGITTGGSTNPTVGITVDDVPYGSSTALGGGTSIPDVDPSDLARIELLRGPQGTLYGASSLGGLIKFVTVDPSTERLSGRLEAGVNGVSHGSDAGLNLRGAFNLPLSSTFAIRASAFTRRDPGYIDNPVTGADDINDQRVRGGRIGALWALSDAVTLKLGALYQDFDADEVNSADPRLGGLQQNFIRGSEGNHGSIEAYSASLTAQLGESELTVLSGYNIRKFFFTDDFSAAFGAATAGLYGVSGAAVTTDQKNEKFTQEVRLAMPLATRVDLLVGGFYTHENAPAVQDVVAVDPATGAAVAVGYHSTFPTRYEEYAAFTNLTVRLSDRFDIQLGGRASRMQADSLAALSVAPIFGSTTPLLTQPNASSARPFTYLLTPRFKVSADLMVYARIASGYRAGGPNVQSCAFYGTFPCEFEPDKTQNYEIGAKGTLFDGALSFDGSLYHIDWKNIQLQTSDPVSHTFYNTNASRARSQGAELSLEARPADALVISTWASWNDAELTEPFPTNAPVVGESGDRLPYGSRFSANLAVDQSFPLGNATAFFGGSLSYVGKRFGMFKALGVARQELPSYGRTDLRTGVHYDTWEVTLYANNVFDRRALLQGPVDTFPSVNIFIQPRTVGISLAKSF